MIFWPRQEELRRINLYYLPLMCVAAPLIGSFASVLVIAGMLWAAVQLARPGLSYSEDRTIRLIALCFAALFAAECFADLINGNGKRMWTSVLADLPFLGLLPLYSVFRAPRGEIVAALEKASFISSFAAFVLALVQFSLFGLRAEGGAGNAAVFAVTCLILFSLNVLALFRNRGTMAWLAKLAALAALCAVVLSGTRALWPGLLLVPLAAVLLYARPCRLKIPRSLLLAAAALLGLAGLALYGPVSERVSLGLNDFVRLENQDYKTSLGERMLLWKVGSQLIVQKPLFGHGPSAVKGLISSTTEALSGTALTFSHFHSFVLTYWVRSGIFGVLSVLAILVAPILLGARRRQDDIGHYGFALLVCTVTAYVLSGLFGIMLAQDIMQTSFIALTAVSLYLVLHREPGAHEQDA